MRTPELQPNAENATLDELRVAMDAAPNKRSYVRLNAMRSLLMGISRATVCQQFCRTDRMVRLWIEMFILILGNYFRIEQMDAVLAGWSIKLLRALQRR